MLNSGCWIDKKDVHGFLGTPVNIATLEECQGVCINTTKCVAIDWEPTHIAGLSCWLLTSTNAESTLQTGIITHYELRPECLSQSHF